MAKDQLKDFHLFAMESVLPFGMGIIHNARTGGLKKIMNVFKSKDPLSELQVNGESSAKKVRDKLDELIPGLGHPVIAVDVTVEENYPDGKITDRNSLISALNRIDNRLENLKNLLDNSSSNIDDE